MRIEDSETKAIFAILLSCVYNRGNFRRTSLRFSVFIFQSSMELAFDIFGIAIMFFTILWIVIMKGFSIWDSFWG